MVAERRLTQYAELHGCSCKVDQEQLQDLLEDVGLAGHDDTLLIGVGDDAAAMALSEELVLVSTIDYFTPIVDDPHDFGAIAACNAASDAFATGAIDDLGMLAVLAMPRELSDATSAVLSGMRRAIEAMEGAIVGGHTILNPWPIAGGAVYATTGDSSLLRTDGAQVGDQLYLTKPLGTQPAMGAYRERDGEFAETIAEATHRPIEDIADEAIAWMKTPNRAAAAVGREVATAATDVTGFGLAGQCRELAGHSNVGVDITRLPVIAGTPALSSLFGYGLRAGESAETSGGLLVTVPDEDAHRLESAFDAAGVFLRQVGQITDGAGVSIADPTIEPVQGPPDRDSIVSAGE